MKYDFDRIVDRRQTGESKWKVKENELPMWIADMDFETADVIKEEIIKRASLGTFGYTEPSDEWYKSYQDFYYERHQLRIEKEWLVFSLGVVPTISSSVRKLTSVGDNVVVMTPVYNIFFNSIVNNQRNPLEVPLIYENGAYRIDFTSLEKAFSLERTTLMILCNPHNPISKIWTKEELDRIGRLAYQYHVIVISDEIHNELVRPGKKYVPFLLANEINKDITVMCVSPTKSFSIAGIQTSAIVIPNSDLRAKVIRQINTDEVAEPNTFSCVAAIAAFQKGRTWLDELREYLFDNRDYAVSYIRKEIPSLLPVDGDATYLLWVDATRITDNSKDYVEYLRKETGLYLSSGYVYGKVGETFFRMNVACPREVLKDGLNRLKEGTQSYLKKKTAQS